MSAATPVPGAISAIGATRRSVSLSAPRRVAAEWAATQAAAALPGSAVRALALGGNQLRDVGRGSAGALAAGTAKVLPPQQPPAAPAPGRPCTRRPPRCDLSPCRILLVVRSGGATDYA